MRPEEDEVPAAPLKDAREVARRLRGTAECLWDALIKGLGKVLGFGDAPEVQAESEDDAEAGTRSFHVSRCSVAKPRDAPFLPRAAGRLYSTGLAQMLE